MGLQSLPIAVGVYLPISTSSAMFAGGVVRWLVERRGAGGAERTIAEVESGPGVLFSSGLIAGGALAGVAIAGVAARGPGRRRRRRSRRPTTWRTSLDSRARSARWPRTT